MIDIALNIAATGLVLLLPGIAFAGASAMLEAFEDGPLAVAAVIALGFAVLLLLGGITAAGIISVWT